MARLLFLQNIAFEYFGPMYLSAVAKAGGHECELLLIANKKQLYSEIKALAPDALLISTTTGPHTFYLEFLKQLKQELAVPVIMGGPHPTFFPQVLQEPVVDYICVGEGEGAVVDFADALDCKKEFADIPNLGYKTDTGQSVYNPVRDLVSDLDAIPFPDWGLYHKRYPFLANYPTKRFLTARGCPYDCSFCFNCSYKSIYRNKGKFIRHRSADNIFREIEQMRRTGKMRTVRFPDDSFSINRKWLHSFLERYQEEVKLPFTCLVRANEIANEQTVVKLKTAGCVNLFFGIESGNERIRNTILKKSLSNKDIISAASLLHQHKISFGTYNMIGAPAETLEDCYATIRLNQQIRTKMPSSTILQPYPGTVLAQNAQEQGLLPDDYTVDNFSVMTAGSILKLANKREMVNLNSFFYCAVRFPLLFPLIKKLIKLPPNAIFRFFSFVSMGIVRLRAQNIGIMDGLRIALRFYRNL